MRNELAVVFGGTGFLGRYIVPKLAKQRARVAIPTRRPARAMPLKTAGQVGQIVGMRTDLRDEEQLKRALEGASYVVNLIGILHGSQKAFEFLQSDLPGRIARIAQQQGVKRLVHVSAIGADADSPSMYARTKAEGEHNVRAAFPNAVILRPSIVFGAEDGFFNRFGQMAKLLPVLPSIGGGHTLFQPVYVDDVARAVMTGLQDPATSGQLYELGGPSAVSFADLLRYIMHQTGHKRPLVPLPFALAELQGRVLGLLPEPPLTRDQVLLLKSDNVVAEGAKTLSDLGITPTPYEMIMPRYLSRYAKLGAPARQLAAPMGDRRVSPAGTPR